MIHFHSLTIADIKRETPDCVSIGLNIPSELEETFRYKHGQYLTLRIPINGEEVRRSYSICSSPLDAELRIAVKKVVGGVFSCYANNQLKPGDSIEAMPPLGKFFTELNPAHRKKYVAFAAGSGITPILSIVKTVLLTEPHSNVVLVYGNRSRQSLLFKDELDALKNKFINRFSMLHVLSREKMDAAINFGRIDVEKCRLLFQKAIDAQAADEFFICGPEQMIFTVKQCLHELGIDEKKIHFELFAPMGKQVSKQTAHHAGENTEVKSKITIKLDGSSFDFELGFDGVSILDAALQTGADLPFACKGGVCCTCKAKLLQGEVDMDVNYGLEHDEIEQNFILTCQSHPRTERVVIDFDIR